jgi:hypothetical protein
MTSELTAAAAGATNQFSDPDFISKCNEQFFRLHQMSPMDPVAIREAIDVWVSWNAMCKASLESNGENVKAAWERYVACYREATMIVERFAARMKVEIEYGEDGNSIITESTILHLQGALRELEVPVRTHAPRKNKVAKSNVERIKEAIVRLCKSEPNLLDKKNNTIITKLRVNGILVSTSDAHKAIGELKKVPGSIGTAGN